MDNRWNKGTTEAVRPNIWQKIINPANVLTLAGLAGCILFMIYGMQRQIFTSQEALENFLMPLGVAAPLLFVIIQIVQVVLPIIPAGLSCLAGVLLFGPIGGFIYNYIGICIGSMFAFLISRRFGMKAVERIADSKAIGKYMGWVHNGKFDKWFAIAIFAPVAPDDVLCFLAGVTTMKFKKFMTIILLGKPFAIAAYSMGLHLIFTRLLGLGG
ncbi:TVP38/TMEM64 family protein [Anaerolentibacter hominis]|uniref:TVP38/TMEM64 family protein n=1 Tax=Anaerolentibacter hominis TaxID=3079009 RepID=UPI0031B839F4